MRQLLALPLLLAACAPFRPDPSMQALLDEIQRTTPTCSSVQECNVKWDAAQLWVAKNAGMKIQFATNVLIQTYNTPPYDVQLAARVTKEPAGQGKYKIVATFWCSNFIGCSPNRLTAALDFNKTLNMVEF